MFCMAHCTLWKFQWLFLHILTACFCSSFQSVKLSFNAPLWEYQGSRAAFLLLLVYLQKHLHHSIYVCGIMNVNASRFYKKFSNVSWMWSHQMKNLVSFVLLSLILKKVTLGEKIDMLFKSFNVLFFLFFKRFTCLWKRKEDLKTYIQKYSNPLKKTCWRAQLRMSLCDTVTWRSPLSLIHFKFCTGVPLGCFWYPPGGAISAFPEWNHKETRLDQF